MADDAVHILLAMRMPGIGYKRIFWRVILASNYSYIPLVPHIMSSQQEAPAVIQMLSDKWVIYAQPCKTSPLTQHGAELCLHCCYWWVYNPLDAMLFICFSSPYRVRHPSLSTIWDQPHLVQEAQSRFKPLHRGSLFNPGCIFHWYIWKFLCHFTWGVWK